MSTAFRRFHALLAGATIAAAAGSAIAQTSEQPATHDASPRPSAPITEANAPPPLKLGLRLLTVWQRLPVAPTLVIVPDAESYLSALERWELGAMWPVLIDDGSDDARENIARFVRAYTPTQILRWSTPKREEPDDASLAARVDAMVAHTWGAPSPDALDARWKELNFEPPGVVVASEDDPAWVAGAALAAGHGQHIFWTTKPNGRPAQQMDSAELDALNQAIVAGLGAQEWPWRALGDAIDGVTLCLNAPGRIEPPPGEDGDFALTDRIGRHANADRWAWCGIVFGDPAEAAYRAMCALFLAPETGWVFDGYDRGYPPQFAGEHALTLFERRNFPVVFTSPQGAKLEVWRGRCRAGIDGGYVQVNSAGHPTWFQLAEKERAFASETPLLRTPSVVYFIHSFSARFADNPTTISGRWLENGAYAYIGSVHEPTLGGFVSPEQYFTRLFSGVPFGAAGRYDNGPPWKIQVIGDPLIIAGTPRSRREVEPALEGATPEESLMKSALDERRFAEAAGLLVELGRDDDALRLVRSTLDQAGKDADRAGVARAGIYPAFRAWDAELFARLYALLPRKIASDASHQSMLWQILRPSLEVGEPDPHVVDLLRHNIRDESAVEDAADLRPAISRLYGRDGVNAMYIELIDRVKNQRTKGRLREAMGPG